MTYSISVVLPNYNGRNLLQSNLPSLIASLDAAKCTYEIIVVDDCSSDDSVTILNEKFPSVQVIQNEINQGFSATCNKGIHAAQYTLLCIVNTDVTFTVDYFKNAIKHFINPNLFAVKGNIINYADFFENIVNVEKTSLMYFKRGFLRFNQRIHYIPNSFTGYIDGQFVLLGCAFVCDRQKMLLLGGFDEIFSPFYWEDADLAIRALREGYQLEYDPECIVYHQTSSTIGTYRSNTRRRLVSMRNKFLFAWRHLKGLKQWSLHLFYTCFYILTRWAILDWKYYFSLCTALYRLTEFDLKRQHQ